MVYVKRPENLQHLTNRILREARSICEESIGRVVNEFITDRDFVNSLLAINLKFEHFVKVNITSCGNIDLFDTVKSTKSYLKFTLVLYCFCFVLHRFSP